MVTEVRGEQGVDSGLHFKSLMTQLKENTSS